MTDWQNRIIKYDIKPASQFTAHPDNPRRHPKSQSDATKASIDTLGWYDVVIENQRTGYVIDGHDRLWLALEQGDDTPVPYILVDLSEDEEAQALLTHDWLTTLAQYDRESTRTLIEKAHTDKPALQQLISDQAKAQGLFIEDVASSEDIDPDTPLTKGDIPDAIFPTDNDYGIPVLDMAMQADALDLPFVTWGSIARTSQVKGTIHFYTDDSRFEALWLDPSPVINSHCVNLVEPNFSCYDHMPRAVVLWHVYRKRWLARYWQSRGIRVLVDLNVSLAHRNDNRLGIPSGWSAFCTRGYTERLDATEIEYQLACEIAGKLPALFVVYGGGYAVRNYCTEKAWLWLPEQQDIAKGKFTYG